MPDEVIGCRVVVTGLAGSGKSTFCRDLAEKTGLPTVSLDLHFWKPGWTEPTPGEWRAKQADVLAGNSWIADGNYHETLPLRLELCDTVIVMDTPWLRCFGRALVRGIRPHRGELPVGSERSRWRQLVDEWGVASRVVRKRQWEPELERELIAEHANHATVYVLSSPAQAAEFLDGVRLAR